MWARLSATSPWFRHNIPNIFSNRLDAMSGLILSVQDKQNYKQYCSTQGEALPPLYESSCIVCGFPSPNLNVGQAGPQSYQDFPRPHRCTFRTLLYIQHLHTNGWMPEQLFDEWMGVNGYAYQLGRNDSLLSLWDERHVETICGRTGKMSQLNYNVGTFNVKHTALLIIPCKYHRHSAHVQIKNNKSIAKMGRKHYKVLNKIFPPPSEVDKNKSNVDIASLIFHAVRDGKTSDINRALLTVPVGTHNPTALARVVHSIGNPSYVRMHNIIMDDRACCMAPGNTHKYFKAVTTALRRTSRWPDGQKATIEEVTACSYWEMAAGRGIFSSDWKKEKKNRVNNRLYLALPDEGSSTTNDETHRRYLEDVQPEIDAVMAELINGKVNWQTWPEAVKHRQSWISSGSAGNKTWLVRGKKVRLDKPAYFESVPPKEVESWIDQEPRIQARASDKYEQSKARAIYATGVKDYAIMTYAIGPAERRLHQIEGVETGLRGTDEIRATLRKMNICANNHESTMLDYADFNLQHSLKVQSMVFDSMARRMALVGSRPDAIRACNWCSKALLNSWCRFPNESQNYRISQGLFSGIRGTNFLNTILNVVYFRHARRWVYKMFGIHPLDLYNIHQGDDVWITNRSRLWAICLFRVMKQIGYDFQESKQLFDCGRGEFLRVVYEKDVSLGYLARSLGGLLEKPIQSAVSLPPSERATALNSEIMIMMRRGLSADACKILWNAIVPHAARVALPGKGCPGYSIPISVLMKSKERGGLDLGPPLTMSDGSEVRNAPIPQPIFYTKELEEDVPKHMSTDWVKVISEGYKNPLKSESIKERLHKNNLKGSVPGSTKSSALRQLIKKSKLWHQKLEPGGIVRSSIIFTNWFSKNIHYDAWWFRDIMEKLFRDKKMKKSPPERFPVPTIMTAVATSPFRDISTAKQALDCSVYEAAEVAISLSRDRELSSTAMGALKFLGNVLGRELLTYILNGTDGPGPTLEAIFNPNLLSWVVQHVMARTVAVATLKYITKITDFENLYKTLLQQAVITAASHKQFIKLNRW